MRIGFDEDDDELPALAPEPTPTVLALLAAARLVDEMETLIAEGRVLQHRDAELAARIRSRVGVNPGDVQAIEDERRGALARVAASIAGWPC